VPTTYLLAERHQDQVVAGAQKVLAPKRNGQVCSFSGGPLQSNKALVPSVTRSPAGNPGIGGGQRGSGGRHDRC
jgi:hypothetical protein